MPDKGLNLKAMYQPEHNAVVLSCSQQGLFALCRAIIDLLESDAPGAHWHLEDVEGTGLEGNLSSVVIEKTTL